MREARLAPQALEEAHVAPRRGALLQRRDQATDRGMTPANALERRQNLGGRARRPRGAIPQSAREARAYKAKHNTPPLEPVSSRTRKQGKSGQC